MRPSVQHIELSGHAYPVGVKECLCVLLRGRQPLVVCPARSIEGMRIPAAWRKSIDDGRLLLLSPFPQKERRATERNAVIRNRFVVALARKMLVAYAEPAGKTEEVCRDAIASGRFVYTLADGANSRLIAMGATPIGPDGAVSALGES